MRHGGEMAGIERWRGLAVWQGEVSCCGGWWWCVGACGRGWLTSRGEMRGRTLYATARLYDWLFATAKRDEWLFEEGDWWTCG